jgi:hypothetical protein
VSLWDGSYRSAGSRSTARVRSSALGRVGVAASGLEAGVAEELRHDDEVCPSSYQGGGEAMP